MAAIESTALAAVLYAAMILFSAFYASPFAFLLAVMSFMGGAAALFGLLFLPTFRLGECRVPAPYLRAYIAYALRRKGYRVEESSEHLTVRLGALAAIRVVVRPAAQGSAISMRAYATSSGWGTLVTLTVIPEAAPLAVGAVLYAFRKARRFARREVTAVVREAETSPAPPRLDDVQVLLVNGLAEGHRLAAEAYEALRSAYSDSLVVLGLATVLVWIVALVVVLLLSPQPFATRDWTLPLVVATGSAAVLPMVVGGLLWRRVRPRMRECRSWVERFRTALARETLRAPPDPVESSSIELLLAASKEIPSWMEGRRWSGLSGDQAAAWILFLLAMGAFWLLEYAVFAFLQGDFRTAVPSSLGGIGLAVAAYLYWRRWRREQDAEIRRTMEEWRRRSEALSTQLGGFLESL